MIPGLPLWGRVGNYSGTKPAALALAAASGTGRAAVVDTHQGLCFGMDSYGLRIMSLRIAGWSGDSTIRREGGCG